MEKNPEHMSVRKRSLRIRFEVVRTIQLEPIIVARGEPVILRIEILKNCAASPKYEARLWRLDTYRMLPTFPQKAGQSRSRLADECLWVEEIGILENARAGFGKTPDAALKSALAAVAVQFGMDRRGQG